MEEGQFWLYSMLLGCALAFVYDCLRIFRRVFSHGIFWISAEDLAYWAFAAGCFFRLLYYESDGVLRWFAVLGAALGMLFYRRTVSPFWVKYMSALLRLVRRGTERALRVIAGPFAAAGRFAAGQAAGGARRGKRAMRIFKKRLTVWAKLARMVLCKRKALRGRKDG